ncbi:MAG: hypothetical protein PHY94_05245 [Candidatus Omnitrophica bacterium]|nr:hypothetical protein [Candidatus Omnitrophota bacterium]
MRKSTLGQGVMFFATVVFVFQLAGLGYVHAQDDQETIDDSEEFWGEPPISNVYDERLGTRSTDLDHQIDTAGYQNSSDLRTNNLTTEDPTVRSQAAWQDVMGQMRDGAQTAAVQVYDSNQDKEYRLIRTNDGVNVANDGNRFMVQEAVRNGDNIEYRTVAPSEQALNLNDQGLQIRALMVKPGQDMSTGTWSGQWEADGVKEVNVLANWGRTDTSNTFSVLPPVEQRPMKVTSVEVVPLPDTRTFQERMTSEFRDAVNPDPYHKLDKAIEDVGNTLRRNMIVVEGVDPNNPAGGRTVITGQTNVQGGSDIRMYTPQNGLQLYDPNSGQLSAPRQPAAQEPPLQLPTFTVVGQDGKPVTNPDVFPHSRTKITMDNGQE